MSGNGLPNHVRAQLRSAISDLLTGLPTTEGRVFRSRLFSLESDELPSISVFTTDEGSAEEATAQTIGSPVLIRRSLPLFIEGHALVDDSIDDQLDRIAMEIEKAMSAEIRVGEKSVSAKLSSTQLFLSGEGESQIGVVRLTYSITYATQEHTPEILE